ncbi:MAG: UDP-glucose 4-epimerase GalE [Chloroflexi bacterium]|nr:UDP-glucose 4-epimerase GalE [Chloroflexota bacterium]
MNVFVTGGAGYIGGMVAQALLEAGHQVTIYDNLSKGHRAAIPQGASFIRGDILSQDELDRAMGAQVYDAVLHFAALIEAGESMKDPTRFFHNNVTGSAHLIDCAQRHGVDRIVFSSSAGVYQSKDDPLCEDDPVGPSSVYGETKLMVERMLHWYHVVFGLKVAVLRYFNAAGAIPGRGEAHQPESHLIPLVLQVALGQREKIFVYGDDYPTSDGSCIRDYVHIVDLASAHLSALAALNDQRPFLTYNLGTGRGFSVKEVIAAARTITGHPIPAEVTPRRPGDAARLVADSSRIQAELGWQPSIPTITDIIRSAWEWHQSHPTGYEV